MKILITGGAGFLGYHLANSLLNTCDHLHLVDNFSRAVRDKALNELLEKGVKLIDCDLTHYNIFENFADDYDYIYNFAAIVGVSNVQKKPYQVLHDNALLNLNALSLASRQTRIKRFIFASTSEVYAGTLEHFLLPIPTPEETPLALPALNRPRTTYMLSKIYGEALSYHSGLPITIVRPHNIYGPRMGLSHVIPELLKKAHDAKEGSEIEIFSPTHCRTFCYVQDAIEMIRKVAEIPEGEGQVFNIGNQEPEIQILDLAHLITKIVGKTLTFSQQPPTIGSPIRRCPDMNRTKKTIGTSSSINLKEGISLTYNWYNTHLFQSSELSAQ